MDQRFGLLVGIAGDSKIIEYLDGKENLRILPNSLSLVGVRPGSCDQDAYSISLLDPRGETRRWRLPARPAADWVFREHNDDPELPMDVQDEIRREVLEMGAHLAQEEAKRRRTGEWPVELCRDVLRGKEDALRMQKLAQQAAQYAAHLHGGPVSIKLRYDRPGRSVASRVRPEADGRISTLSGADMERLEEGFSWACERLWPEGWMRTIGPERAAGLLAWKQLARASGSVREAPSNHQALELLALFGRPPPKV